MLVLVHLALIGCSREFKFPTNYEELQATRRVRQYFQVQRPAQLMQAVGFDPYPSNPELQILLQAELAALMSDDAIASATSATEFQQWEIAAAGADPVAWVREHLVVFSPSAGSELLEMAFVDGRSPSAAMLAIVESLTAQYTERAELEEKARHAFLEAKQWRGERSKLSEPLAAAYADWESRVESATADLLRGDSQFPLPEHVQEEIKKSDFGSRSREEVVEVIHNKVAFWLERKQPIFKLSQFGTAEFHDGR
ncbi:hypothetical protein [Posidoniimonas polymericola]|uniref:hypothetical protein n=1 Tax=Posidoniimonas polymericola TaxID=2528002 RepID=UPI0011B4EE48|nr:hypothetical protein [Posidoniimonas polymericola]